MKTIFFILFAFSMRCFCCAPVWDEDNGPVKIQGEKSLIVWDQQSQKEHFFRSVTFHGSGKESGFIVPVPAVPEVADAGDDLFNQLDNAIENERPKDYVFFKMVKKMLTRAAEKSLGSVDGLGSAVPGGVSVLAEYQLANYDVKIIEATSIEPLKNWLEENKFKMRTQLADWLESYLQQKWIFAVFVFRPAENETTFSTKAVRISFSTNRPVYPYKEPLDDLPETNRILNLYLLAATQFNPELSDGETKNWTGPEYSLKIKASVPEIVKVSSKEKWLTVWKDVTPTGKRPYRDLYFKPIENSQEVLPYPPVQVDLGPYVAWAVLILILTLIGYRVARKSRK